jgi:hypothetical protein
MIFLCLQSANRRKVFSEVAAFVLLHSDFFAELSGNQEREFVNSLAKIVKRVLAGVVLLAGLVYGGDYLFVRYRMAYPKAGAAFGSVVMERLYAIPQKNGATEYEFDARQPEVNTTCIHSLFPHLGYQPCWYLQRNSQKPIPMVILPMTTHVARSNRLALEQRWILSGQRRRQLVASWPCSTYFLPY